jgi:hypothetical protein
MPRKRQPRTQKDNHGDGQEGCNQEHKRMTITIARRSTIKNTRRHNDGQEVHN